MTGPPKLNAEISTSFPEADILGFRLVNGRPTKALIEIHNKDAEPISVAFVAGALMRLDPIPDDVPAYLGILTNLTAVQYQLPIDAGETKTLPYSFAIDMQPQDVRLELVAVVSSAKGNLYTMQAHNGTAAIVEPPTSFFDPQMYVEPRPIPLPCYAPSQCLNLG